MLGIRVHINPQQWNVSNQLLWLRYAVTSGALADLEPGVLDITQKQQVYLPLALWEERMTAAAESGDREAAESELDEDRPATTSSAENDEEKDDNDIPIPGAANQADLRKRSETLAPAAHLST